MAAPGSQAAQASVSLELWMEFTDVPLKSVADGLTTWKMTKPCGQILIVAFLWWTTRVYVGVQIELAC